MSYFVYSAVSGLIDEFKTFDEASQYVLKDAKENYLENGDEYDNFAEYFESEYADVEILSKEEAIELGYPID